MAITVLTRDKWKMVPAGERGASTTAKLHGMHLHDEHPFLVLLEEPPDTYTPVHSHNQPEVMVVLEGHITLNGQRCEPGTRDLPPGERRLLAFDRFREMCGRAHAPIEERTVPPRQGIDAAGVEERAQVPWRIENWLSSAREIQN